MGFGHFFRKCCVSFLVAVQAAGMGRGSDVTRGIRRPKQNLRRPYEDSPRVDCGCHRRDSCPTGIGSDRMLGMTASTKTRRFLIHDGGVDVAGA